jgi:hypothetical protein
MFARGRSFATAARSEETSMDKSKALSGLLIVALLTALSGPALAKKKQKTQQATKTTQKQSAKVKCVTTAPPFMRNPRFMNRGFFKKKCYKVKE